MSPAIADRGRCHRGNGGFSLIELLVALTLGLVLIAGMIAVFAGNRRSSDLNTATANMQESARFALGAMSRDIRMAGFQGCIDLNRGAATVRATGAPTTDLRSTASRAAVVGAGNVWTPAAPPTLDVTTLDPLPVPGTHVLLLQYGDPNTATLVAQLNDGGVPSPGGPVRLDRDIGLVSGDLAVIADCETADLFRVTGAAAGGTVLAHGPSGNTSGALTRAYGDARNIGQTSVKRFVSNLYYIGDTGFVNESGDPVRSLYQLSLPYDTPGANPPIELVQGIDNMRIALGIRLGNGSLSHLPPDDPAVDLARVESVQIGLLMTSWDRIAPDDDVRTYVLAGQQVPAGSGGGDASAHAGDSRFRLAFNTTVKIRNQRSGAL